MFIFSHSNLKGFTNWWKKVLILFQISKLGCVYTYKLNFLTHAFWIGNILVKTQHNVVHFYLSYLKQPWFGLTGSKNTFSTGINIVSKLSLKQIIKCEAQFFLFFSRPECPSECSPIGCDRYHYSGLLVGARAGQWVASGLQDLFFASGSIFTNPIATYFYSIAKQIWYQYLFETWGTSFFISIQPQYQLISSGNLHIFIFC